jgi:oligosaccharyltransferase complex subunit gamma
MRLSSVFAAVLSLSIPVLAAKQSKKNPHAQLVELAAAAPGGNIQLDEHTFDLLTSSNRNWTAAVQFTALDPRRRCNPCRCNLTVLQ